MAWRKPKGYLLPEGEAFTEELACALVYFPDKPEYRRALRGSLDFLATWTAWETDPLKRGKDAARAWKIANERTQECIEMGVCLEELIDAVNNLKLSVSYNVDCFCENFSINPPEPTYEDVPPGSVFPPTYGDHEISTQEEYRRVVCHNAHRYVDVLKEQNDTLLSLLELGTMAVGLIAAILAVLSSGGLLMVIGYGTAATIFSSLVALAGWEFLGDVSADIEAARAEIVESIICGTPALASVIEQAIDNDAWTLFYQYVNWGQAAASIRSGEFNGESHPYGQNTSCDIYCPETPFSFTFDFLADEQGWVLTGGQWQSGGYVRISVGGTGASNFIRLNLSTIWALLDVDEGTPVTFTNFELDASPDTLSVPAGVQFRINTDPSSVWEGAEHTVPTSEAVHVADSPPATAFSGTNDSVRVYGLRNGVAGQNIGVDNILIEGYWEPAVE